MTTDRLPPFPAPPSDADRLSHMPSVVDGLRYWRAVLATAEPGGASARTAATMIDIYSEAREVLLGRVAAVGR